MKLITQKTGLTLATTAALLLAGCASDKDDKAVAKGKDIGQCHGVNSCKGNSVCATAESSCAGHNSCKGKGWLSMSASECNAKGGKFKKN